MASDAVRVRLAQETGRRIFLRIYWGTLDAATHGGRAFHDARRLVQELDDPFPPIIQIGDYDRPDAYADRPTLWPDRCDQCGLAVPDGAYLNTSSDEPMERPIYQVHPERRYDTPTRAGPSSPATCTGRPGCTGRFGRWTRPLNRRGRRRGRARVSTGMTAWILAGTCP